MTVAHPIVRGELGHVVVVGAGVTGLTTAHRLLSGDPRVAVTVLEASDRVGGKIHTSPFAGLPAVDEAADAYLTRVPFAVRLARELGLGDTITHPATGSAAVWHDGLCPLPDGLLLGVPTGVSALLRSRLLTTRGALRAGLEPLLPRTSTEHDCIGDWVRARFGHQVHERLLDPLVGSIYAADTDRFSLATVPQLAALAEHRSALLGARRQRRAAPPAAGPVFEAPLDGMGRLVERLAAAVTELGGDLRTGQPVSLVEPGPGGAGYRVHAPDGTVDADRVVLACPAAAAAGALRELDPVASQALGRIEAASVVMVALAVPAPHWTLGRQLSGYLVPKPDQRHVTAVSFASNKWAHWRPADGSMVLRVSLGRDGLVVDDWDDERLVTTAVAEVSEHLGLDLEPTDVRLTRWPGAFPQYRPGHLARLDAIERELAATAPGVLLAGASHRGMGIPACVQQGDRAAAASLASLTRVRD